MAIPAMDERGLLPPGVHDCSVDEIGRHFGRPAPPRRRGDLFAKLQVFMSEVRSTDPIAEAIVDGSFVTSEQDPHDIDLVIVLKAGHDYGQALRPFEYNLLSRRRVRRQYGFDVLVARQNGTELAQYIEFFEQVRDSPGRRTGLLRVRPWSPMIRS